MKVGTRNANRATLPNQRPPYRPKATKVKIIDIFRNEKLLNGYGGKHLNNFVDDLRLQVYHCITLHAFR